jgi:hypothetical protein
MTYAPFTFIVLSSPPTALVIPCRVRNSISIVSLCTPFRRFSIKLSKRIRVLSFHQPGWPAVVCKICCRQ